MHELREFAEEAMNEGPSPLVVGLVIFASLAIGSYISSKINKKNKPTDDLNIDDIIRGQSGFVFKISKYEQSMVNQGIETYFEGSRPTDQFLGWVDRTLMMAEKYELGAKEISLLIQIRKDYPDNIQSL